MVEADGGSDPEIALGILGQAHQIICFGIAQIGVRFENRERAVSVVKRKARPAADPYPTLSIPFNKSDEITGQAGGVGGIVPKMSPGSVRPVLEGNAGGG